MNTTPFLLDTSVLLLLVRGGPMARYIRAVYQLDELAQRAVVCVVSHGELRAMAARRGWGEDKHRRLLEVLGDHVTVDLDGEPVLEAYVEADRISRAVREGARTIGDNDRWIAAASKACGAVLLTADRDFLHFAATGFCPVQYVDQNSRLLTESSGERQP